MLRLELTGLATSLLWWSTQFQVSAKTSNFQWVGSMKRLLRLLPVPWEYRAAGLIGDWSNNRKSSPRAFLIALCVLAIGVAVTAMNAPSEEVCAGLTTENTEYFNLGCHIK